MVSFRSDPARLNLWQRVQRLNWFYIGLILVLSTAGFLTLYSAAGASLDPWAKRQMIRFAPMIILMIGIALIDIKYWMMLSWPLWGVGILLLIVVALFGHTGMGAQRWINLGFMKLQPSELMKIAVIMAVASYYHILPKEQLKSIKAQIIPLIAMGVPFLLVQAQPDLGTALMIVMAGLTMMFLAGVWMGYFIIGGGLAAIIIPLFWMFGMKDYQRERVLTFLNPERDPLGAGYHITQSKIAIGSGGWAGKGYTESTQSRLNFLPEKHTDFIFTHFAEEWGFWGGVSLIALVAVITLYGLIIAMMTRHVFGKLLVLGLSFNFFLYVFINIGMVMGLLPVVGVPLPLFSYGGTSMMAAMISFGLILSVWIHRERSMPGGDHGGVG